MNSRAVGALEGITGQALGEDGEGWKEWFADEQGYSYRRPSGSERPKRTLVQWTHGDSSWHSCFAAGTPVKTIDGDRPIEMLKVGDRVLTQDAETGALDFQSIVAIYHNRPNATLRLDLEGRGEAVVATPIHRFWKAGLGWVMARDLKAGDVIRSVGGTARVTSVEKDRVQPVYNLEVASGRSFFVGRTGLLVHDNSLVEPVSEPFDARPALASSRGE
jgi:hypothetical protein